MSQAIIAALDGYRDLRDRSIEQIFLGVYGSPVLQAMLGLRGSETAPRQSPGIDPARAALIKQRIGELKSRLAEGGPREAVIRALVYIGMAGPGVDERAFNELRQIRAENQGLTLQAFKQVLREQFFSLMLDRDAALEGIAKMLPADAAGRKALLAVIHRTVEAAGAAERRARAAVGADRGDVCRRRCAEAARKGATPDRRVGSDDAPCQEVQGQGAVGAEVTRLRRAAPVD